MAEGVGIDRDRERIADDEQPGEASRQPAPVEFLQELERAARLVVLARQPRIAERRDDRDDARDHEAKPCPLRGDRDDDAQRDVDPAAHHPAGRERPNPDGTELLRAFAHAPDTRFAISAKRLFVRIYP